MNNELEAIDMAGLTPLQQALRRTNRCQMEFYQSGSLHRCWLAVGHPGYHYVNEWGVLYWAHSLQKFGQATEEFMEQIVRGEAIMLRRPDQTEEDMRKLPALEMDYSVPIRINGTNIEGRVSNLAETVRDMKSDMRDLRNELDRKG